MTADRRWRGLSDRAGARARRLMGLGGRGGGAAAGGGPPMFFRSVRLADLLRLGRLQRRLLQLDLPESAVTGFSPLEAAIAGWLPGRTGRRTYVMGDRQPRAFIQVAMRARGYKWEVVCLGGAAIPETCEGDDHPWLLLLNYVALVAGRRRATRLLAKVPEPAADLACFRRAGFQPYGHEVIYGKVYDADDHLAPGGLDLRAQRPSDDWLVHRLYFQTAPRPVQDAEAYTSHEWELRRARPGGLRERGWLVEDDGETAAYARTLSRRHAHMVEWLYQPAQRAILPDLIRQTLARLPAAPGDHVAWCVRDYQGEAGAALEAAGFVPASEQTLMVKYLAVKVPARPRPFAPVRAKAGGVPSYLRRSGGE